MRTSLIWILGALSVFALGTACDAAGTDADSDADTDTDTDADGDADTDTDTDTDADGDTDTGDTDSESEFVISTDPFETDPDRLVLSAPCPLDERIGEFRVESFDDGDIAYVGISGKVTNGVNPVSVMDEAATEGDCRLLRRRRLICDPPCGAGSVCNEEEHCVPMPVGQDMGVAVLRGLSLNVVLYPLQPGFNYSSNHLPYPGHVDGQVVQLTTTDGWLGALELYGVGVTPLSMDQTGVTLAAGTALSLTWDPPLFDHPGHLYVRINIDQHGLTPLELVCHLPDTGSATIPVSLIDALIDAGVTGFPSGTARRQTVDSFSGPPGCVEFIVSSYADFDVTVTGFTPCTDDSDCDLPQTCNELIEQCE